MSGLKERLILYMKNATGLSVRLSRFEPVQLPLYMKAADEYYTGTVGNTSVLFVVQKKESALTPSDYQKKMELIGSHSNLPVVFVLESVTAYNRERLIKKRVSFVVPGKQMYLLPLLVDLRESFCPENKNLKKVISPVAQCMTIYHLLINPLDEKTSRQIGEMLSYSAMSVSRAVRELRSVGICEGTERAKAPLLFIRDRKEIWEKLRGAAQNPVSLMFGVRKNYNWLNHLKKAGESALSDYSELNAPARPVFAAAADIAERIHKDEREPEDISSNMFPIIQIWKYDPSLLSDGNSVDPLSLYLSMKDNEDERVQSSLETMLNGVNLW
jgi:hypothetical protein